MRNSVLILLFILIPSAQAWTPPDWENQHVLSRNRLPASATFVPYPDVASALTGKTPYVLSLNGPWRFHWSPRPESRPVDFHAPAFDDSAWDTLPIPANWQMHGYGVPIYTSSQYPFRFDPARPRPPRPIGFAPGEATWPRLQWKCQSEE